jgi:hypothetical protein
MGQMSEMGVRFITLRVSVREHRHLKAEARKRRVSLQAHARELLARELAARSAPETSAVSTAGAA